MSRCFIPVILVLLSGCCLARDVRSSRDDATALIQGPSVRGSPACTACRVTAHVLDDLLCDASAIDFLVDFVRTDVCPKLGAPDVSKQCTELSQVLVPVAVQWLRMTASPAQLCSHADVCGSQILQDTDSTKVHYEGTNGFAECAMCKFIVNQVKAKVDDPITEAQIINATLSACQGLPAELQQSCLVLANKYEPVFFQFIDSLEPEKVCEMAGACMVRLAEDVKPPALTPALLKPAELATSAVPARNSLYANDFCDTCKIVVLEAHHMLVDNKTRVEVEDYVRNLCAGFPHFQDQCDELVATYLPEVLDIIASYMDPNTLCVQLGYCTGMARLSQAMQQLTSAILINPIAQRRLR